MLGAAAVATWVAHCYSVLFGPLLFPSSAPPPHPPVCRFNFEGCRFGDLVSHYVRPKQMLCMWAKQGQCRGCEHADDA